MITKSGKHHYVGTLVDYDSKGQETRRLEGFRFTAHDPIRYAEDLHKRFPKVRDWATSKIENLIDLDA